MNQNTTKFVRFLVYKKYSEIRLYPEATVTMVLLIYYHSFLNSYCK